MSTDLRETILEAVPNIATGQAGVAEPVAHQVDATPGCALLDLHSDVDHERSVVTAAGTTEPLVSAMLALTRAAIGRIDLRDYAGAHPCVGAVDVMPIAFLRPEDRPLAEDLALGLANRLASELGLPIFLYGALAADVARRERSYFRDGGLANLAARLEQRELAPDFGPARLHPTAGATLVTARPPLVAFNVELADATLELARSIAAQMREAGGGPTGVRAIGLELQRQRTIQVSMNVHDPFAVSLAELVGAVQARAAAAGARVSGAELVGLAPAAALEGLELSLLRDFDPDKHVLDDRIRINGQL